MKSDRALASLEVRWFFDGRLDPASDLVDRFRTRGVLPVEGAPEDLEWPGAGRVDTYLPISGRADLGIKRRQESEGGPPRLEFKGRIESLEEVEFLPGLRARPEGWIKWSQPETTIPNPLAGVFDHPVGQVGVDVRKERILRRVRLSSPAPAAPVEMGDPQAPIDRGIGFELTRLAIGDRSLWTLGFEAFPDLDPQTEFIPVVRAILTEWRTSAPWDRAIARGYPAQLLALGH